MVLWWSSGGGGGCSGYACGRSCRWGVQSNDRAVRVADAFAEGAWGGGQGGEGGRNEGQAEEGEEQ